MIGLKDTFTLARTKLRSKRILLCITIIVSGLLFGILSAAIIITTGVSRSTERFFTTALNGRYLVDVQPNIPPELWGYDDAFTEPSKEKVQELNTLQEAYIAKQKAIYARHNQTFDKDSVAPVLNASPFGEKDGLGNPKMIINRDSPAYKEYLAKRKLDYTKTAKNKFSDLKNIASQYGATAYHFNQFINLQSQATYLKDGQEKLGQNKQENPSSYEDYLTSNVKNSLYLLTDQVLMQRFIYPENELRKKNKDAIPVILTNQEIVKMFGKELGIDKQPSGAAEQVAWVQELQRKANGHTYSVCYRSTNETALIQETMKANTEMAERRNDKSHLAPRLQYNLPSTPCGELTVKKDIRTTEEKRLLASQESLQKELGTYQPIEHRLLKFQIVGSLSMNVSMSQPSTATGYISYLLGSQYQQGAFIPRQLYDALESKYQNRDILLRASNDAYFDMGIFEAADIKAAVVTFPSLDAARNFINREGCEATGSECKKPFIVSTYGSSYLAIDEVGKFVARFAPIAFFIAVGIAVIIIWVTMARVIIDSRRETAVFRALGAKRRDIIAIYLLYSLLVALLIILFMLILGFVIATVVEALYSSDATNLAKVAYGVFDKLEPYHFMAINLPLLGGLTTCVLAISFIAAIPPLWRNVRRNPIRDMRDE